MTRSSIRIRTVECPTHCTESRAPSSGGKPPVLSGTAGLEKFPATVEATPPSQAQPGASTRAGTRRASAKTVVRIMPPGAAMGFRDMVNNISVPATPTPGARGPRSGRRVGRRCRRGCRHRARVRAVFARPPAAFSRTTDFPPTENERRSPYSTSGRNILRPAPIPRRSSPGAPVRLERPGRLDETLHRTAVPAERVHEEKLRGGHEPVCAERVVQGDDLPAELSDERRASVVVIDVEPGGRNRLEECPGGPLEECVPLPCLSGPGEDRDCCDDGPVETRFRALNPGMSLKPVEVRSHQHEADCHARPARQSASKHRSRQDVVV